LSPSEDSIIFLGTADFALPSLKMILENKFNLAGVLTRPDKPTGRGKKISYSTIKKMALEQGLPLFQPGSKAELESVLLNLQPSILVSVAYGMILPDAVLAIPPLGAINLHPSLLPAYRGAAPMQRALMAGEEQTGVSVFYMASETDAGDLILQQKAAIDPEDSFGTLSQRLAQQGAEMLLEALELIINKNAPRIPQDDALATFAPPLSRDDEIIHWSRDSSSIANQIRALEPEPGAYTMYRGKRLKIWKVAKDAKVAKVVKDAKSAFEAEEAAQSSSPGMILKVEKDFFTVAAAEGQLKILELQPEGKKRMSAEDFLRGYNPQVGERFE